MSADTHVVFYAFSTTTDGPFDRAVDAVRDALAAEGFGVLTTINLADTLYAKLAKNVDPYVILGACHPPSAHSATLAEPEIGTLLPCNVVVREDGDKVHVHFMDPAAVLALVDNDAVRELGIDIRHRLERARDRLS